MKTAIITGASRGIGLAVAKRLAAEGFALMINAGHDKEALTRAHKELSALTEARACFGDIAAEGTGERLVRETLAAWGQVDVLVNNAGLSHIGLLQDMDSQAWRRLMGVNLDGVFYLSRAVIPPMVRRKAGRILNISSVWGEVGASCEAAYSASKGAVNALTKALAKELAPSGICVNAVSFGLIDTAMNGCFSGEERRALAGEVPFGRFASPEEAADFCLQILNAPEYLTGQVIRFDGGWI